MRRVRDEERRAPPYAKGVSATVARALRQNAMARAGAAAKAISGADEETATTATATASMARWCDERSFIPGRRFLRTCAPQFANPY